jgi:hypothetical protein
MANSAPATVTVTSTTGPGQAVASQKFTDVTKIEADFGANVLKVVRQGAGGTQTYDYSALATLTWTISAGVTTIVAST